MTTLYLMMVALAGSVPSPKEALPMPPPPAGMHVLTAEDKQQLLGSAAAEEAPEAAAEDEPEEANEDVEAESAEMEELRALEGAALDPAARPNAEVLQSLRRLGLANPLRLRMLDALEEPILREDTTPPELPLIKDLENFDVAQIQDRYDIPVEMQPQVGVALHALPAGDAAHPRAEGAASGHGVPGDDRERVLLHSVLVGARGGALAVHLRHREDVRAARGLLGGRAQGSH
jgi:hypothetical protein